MSRGLYAIAHVARWLKKQPREMRSLINDHGLPVVPIPAEKGTVDKVTLHGLHAWCRGRAKGAPFMSVDQLAIEMDMCEDSDDERGSQEAELLGEMMSLAEVSRDLLRKGLEPKSVRGALTNVTKAWLSLNTGGTGV